MKKIILAVIFSAVAIPTLALNISEVNRIVDDIDKSVAIQAKLRNFASIALNGFKYSSCINADFEGAGCAILTMSGAEKTTMINRAKELDNKAYALETERHNLIQAQ